MLTSLYFMKGTERGEGDYYRCFRALFFRPEANTAFALAGVDGKLLSVSLARGVRVPSSFSRVRLVRGTSSISVA